MKNKRRLFILISSAICGCLMPFAFAPYHCYPLGFLLPAILIYNWTSTGTRHTSARLAAWSGWLFGTGFFGVGISWIYISIHEFGGAPGILAFLLTALLIAGLALYYALLAWAYQKCTQYFISLNIPERLRIVEQLVPPLFIFPVLWLLFEWVRTWLFTGFPWLLIGYSQIDSVLRGYAPLFTVFGVSFFSVLVSGALYVLLMQKQMINRTVGIVVALLVFGLGYGLGQHQWYHPKGQTVRVSLVQGNIPQVEKWQFKNATKIAQTYWDLTQPHLDSQLIVWPEAAITVPEQYAQLFINQLNAEAKLHNTTILFGIPIHDATTNKDYNGMLAVGQGQGRYLKQHLVPFGEYYPFAWLYQPIMKWIQIPMANFSAGQKKQPMIRAKQIKIAGAICYESAFPEQVLRDARHADVLTVISDDSWFGRSWASAQHLQITQMRALELGKNVLFSTNTGISAIIDQNGKILGKTKQDVRTVLTHDIKI